ncbi:hypothetical protein Tco_0538001 [Tanacetum coccineum]
MSTLTFADTHNMVAFLEKPAKSDGFDEIIDFLNANQIHYALTVNPTIYTSYIEQFWATAKANTINGERQLQALVEKKRVIITESSIRSDLHLEDAGGIDCLPTVAIFEELARMGYEKPSQRLAFYKAFFSPQWKFLIHTITQCLSAKSTAWNEFSSTMASTPITTQPLFSRPQKKQSRRKQRKETEVPQDETHHDDNIPIPSNDPLLSAKEIAGLKKRVYKLEKKKKSRTRGLKRLRKKSTQIEEREVSIGVEDSASPTITVTTADEGVTDVKINEITPTSAPTTIIDELTLAQTLIEIKAAKPKAVTTAATTTTTRPNAIGVVVQELSEFRTTTSSPQASQPSKTKDKGKAIMIEPEVPLKKKDQVALNEEMARNLKAQLQAELIEEEKMARKKKEEANITLIESLENTQAMMEADRLLAERLQTREQEELTDEEKAKLFMEHKKGEGKIIYGAQEDSAKRAGDKLEFDESKKQKADENEEVIEDNEAELKKHLVIVKDDDIAIDAIPLATKPPVIGIDREDLETLWKLVKTKHGDTRPEDEHERVLWGDLKVMFEPDIKSDVWRNLQGYKVTIWKLFDSCGVHFVRNLKIHMMNNKFRGGLLGLKDFKMILRVTVAQCCQETLILPVHVSAAITKG